MMDAGHFAASLASAGLDGRLRLPAVMTAADAELAVRVASKGNVLGLLADLVARREIEAAPQAATLIRTAAIARLIADMRVERACASMVGRLTAEGIRVRVLKGVATALLDHADPSHRSTSDIDILVPSADLRRAVAIARRSGYERDLPERRPRFDERFAKDVTLFGYDRPELDLHRALVKGPFGAAAACDDAFAEGDALTLAGSVDTLALSLPWRLLHSCLIVGAGDRSPSIAIQRDLLLQARDPDLPVEQFGELVERTRASAAVLEAIRAVRATMGVDVPDLVDRRAGSPKWWLTTYAAHGGTDVTTQVAAVAAIPWSTRLAYVHGLAWPTKRYRQARAAAGRRPAMRMLTDALQRTVRTVRDRRKNAR